MFPSRLQPRAQVERPANLDSISTVANSYDWDARGCSIDEHRSLYPNPSPQNLGDSPFVQLPEALSLEITDRIKDCFGQGSLMVSFHSPLGYAKCKSLALSNQLVPIREPQRPTLVQYCLLAQKNNQNVVVNIDGEDYRVEVSESVFNDGEPPSEHSIKHMSGELRLVQRGQSDTAPRHTIPFLELAPPFDGQALKADQLKMCHELVSTYRQSVPGSSPVNTGGSLKIQFSSAIGICRAPSLLIFDQFVQACGATRDGDTLEVDPTVDELIRKAKLKSGNHGLIPYKNQVDELKEVCGAYWRDMQQNRGSQREELPASSPEAFQAEEEPNKSQPASTAPHGSLPDDTSDSLPDDLQKLVDSVGDELQKKVLQKIAEKFQKVRQNRSTEAEFNMLDFTHLCGETVKKIGILISTLEHVTSLRLQLGFERTEDEQALAVAFISEIAKMSQLEKLDLSSSTIGSLGSSISDFGDKLVGLEALKQLKLGSASLSFLGDKLPELGKGIGRLKSLESLNLSDNKFTENSEGAEHLVAFLDELCGLENLQTLEIEGAHLDKCDSSFLPQVAEKIAGMSKLKTLYLSQNRLFEWNDTNLESFFKELAKSQSLDNLVLGSVEDSRSLLEKIKGLIPGFPSRISVEK